MLVLKLVVPALPALTAPRPQMTTLSAVILVPLVPQQQTRTKMTALTAQLALGVPLDQVLKVTASLVLTVWPEPSLTTSTGAIMVKPQLLQQPLVLIHPARTAPLDNGVVKENNRQISVLPQIMSAQQVQLLANTAMLEHTFLVAILQIAAPVTLA